MTDFLSILHIDQLGSQDEETSFLLGVEFGIVATRMESNKVFNQVIHNANSDRILALAKEYKVHAVYEDLQDGFGVLTVGVAESGGYLIHPPVRFSN